MNQEHCAAVKRKREREIQGYKNIAGIIVPDPEKRPSFPIANSHRAQIVQKSDLSPRPVTEYTQELPDFPIGISSRDRNSKSAGSPRTSKTLSSGPGVSKGVQKDKVPALQRLTDPKMENTTRKINVTQSTLLLTLNRIREPVLDYQEARGVPRNVDITFFALVTSLVTQAYTAGLTILVMLWNLMPLVDGFIYFIRFLLDKLIDIVQTVNNKDRAVKAAILFGELTVICIISFFIFGLIFMPVYVLVARLTSKIFSMIAW